MSAPTLAQKLAAAIAPIVEANDDNRPAVLIIGPARYCLIRAAAVATGLTEKAIRRKIEEGYWVEGRHYRKAPDGHVFIDMKAFERWVEGSLP